MASRRVTHVNRSIRSSPRTHNTARGNVLFYLEYAPGQSPGGAIGKRHIGELSRERGGSIPSVALLVASGEGGILRALPASRPAPS